MNIFLAATNCRPTFFSGDNPTFSNGVRFLLESFAYIESWQIPLIRKAEEFILDSGAFTFMHNANRKFDAWEFAERYAAFINEYQIEHYIEIDVDTIIGYKEVLKIRAYLERTTNRQCMPVWHVWRGKDNLMQMFDEYEYACLGGMVSNVGGGALTPKVKMVPHIIRLAHQRNCKLHGLGFTKLDWLEKVRFDSVDSSSWLSGARYGHLYNFNGRTIKQTKRPKNTKTVHYKHLDAHNLCEWMKYVDWAKENL